jgi:hypothetical protein
MQGVATARSFEDLKISFDKVAWAAAVACGPGEPE